MSFDAKDRESGEQLLLERMEAPSAPSSARQARVIDRSPTAAGDIAVRARAPVPQEHPAQQRHVTDSPPLHDDRQPGEDAAHGAKPRAGFLRRHPFAVAFGLVLAIPVAAGGYLYWDNAGHFESTDDSFIAARQLAIQPKVAGYITAVPVTDNQHVAAGAIIARINDRDYVVALDQAEAQLAHDQAVLEQAHKDLGRYQFLSSRNSIAQQQVDDQTFLVAQECPRQGRREKQKFKSEKPLSKRSKPMRSTTAIIALAALVGVSASVPAYAGSASTSRHGARAFDGIWSDGGQQTIAKKRPQREPAQISKEVLRLDLRSQAAC
jgi:membrane fusion protein, multidrug efflux system